MKMPEFQLAAYKFTVAQPSDISAIVQLVNSAYRGEASKKGWTTEADLLGGTRVTADLLCDTINKNNCCVYTCRNTRGQTNACIFLQLNSEKLYVGMLSVSPTLQNKGMGKMLLQLADHVAIVNNCIALTMTVISIRTELVEWYKRQGYLPTGKIFPFDISGSIVLIKEPLYFITLEKRLARF